jgi:peptidoglycan-associated lipoprotein
MNRFLKRAPAGAVALALLVLVAGCSKKAGQEAPATTPPPAVQPASNPPPTTPQEQPAPAPAEPATQNWQDAYFDYDKSDLRDDARAALDADAKMLSDHANAAITIEGHCDERGTPEYNLALGERRANAAKDYLVAHGVDGSRIETISYGEERPFATGHDEASWAQNRRAHLVQK